MTRRFYVSAGIVPPRSGCRGQYGRKCIPVVRLDHTLAGDHGRCKPAPPWYRGGNWWCHHREVCIQCGKVLRYTVTPEECPEFEAVRVEEFSEWLKWHRPPAHAKSAATSRRSA